MIATMREAGTEDSTDRSLAELDEAYLKWIGRVEEQIADISNLHDRDREEFCTRTEGPRFVCGSVHSATLAQAADACPRSP